MVDVVDFGDVVEVLLEVLVVETAVVVVGAEVRVIASFRSNSSNNSVSNTAK